MCLTEPSIVNIINDNGNKYVFNGLTYYDPDLKFGLYNGTYTFENISQSHPMAILNAGFENVISYTGDANTKFTKEVNGIMYDFYYNTMTVTVTGGFGEMSVYCYYHGYMGGENLLMYTPECNITVVS